MPHSDLDSVAVASRSGHPFEQNNLFSIYVIAQSFFSVCSCCSIDQIVAQRFRVPDQVLEYTLCSKSTCQFPDTLDGIEVGTISAEVEPNRA